MHYFVFFKRSALYIRWVKLEGEKIHIFFCKVGKTELARLLVECHSPAVGVTVTVDVALASAARGRTLQHVLMHRQD